MSSNPFADPLTPSFNKLFPNNYPTFEQVLYKLDFYNTDYLSIHKNNFLVLFQYLYKVYDDHSVCVIQELISLLKELQKFINEFDNIPDFKSNINKYKNDTIYNHPNLLKCVENHLIHHKNKIKFMNKNICELYEYAHILIYLTYIKFIKSVIKNNIRPCYLDSDYIDNSEDLEELDDIEDIIDSNERLNPEDIENYKSNNHYIFFTNFKKCLTEQQNNYEFIVTNFNKSKYIRELEKGNILETKSIISDKLLSEIYDFDYIYDCINDDYNTSDYDPEYGNIYDLFNNCSETIYSSVSNFKECNENFLKML